MNMPQGRKLRVAMTLGQGSQVIDVAGPWEVFQDVRVKGESPFELYTVGSSRDMVVMSGGMQIIPNYSVEDAPQPDIIVSPAHENCRLINAWIKRSSVASHIVSSVCTGAYNLAEAGLLDSLTITTYHQSFDSMRKKYPQVNVHRDLRFVDQGQIITSGGLTSCIDMSLHIVRRYLGFEVAQETADILEYEGQGWKHSLGLKPPRCVAANGQPMETGRSCVWPVPYNQSD